MKKNKYGNIEDLVVHVNMVTSKGTIKKQCQVSSCRKSLNYVLFLGSSHFVRARSSPRHFGIRGQLWNNHGSHNQNLPSARKTHVWLDCFSKFRSGCRFFPRSSSTGKNCLNSAHFVLFSDVNQHHCVWSTTSR